MPAVTLNSTECYKASQSTATWTGRHVDSRTDFASFLRGVVARRAADADSGFEQGLRSLATTGMETKFVEEFLKAVPDVRDWELGEAFAECALESDSGFAIYWPWNTVRDRRTPRASLPGADLVGFYLEDENVWIMVGEVKSSSDPKTPPNVMYGEGGMTWQLEQSATSLAIQRTILMWLDARSQQEPYRSYYQNAVKRFISSNGRDILIMGVLVRDTEASEADLKSRGEALSVSITAPCRTHLIAWYLPIPISEWPALIKGEAT